MKALPRSLLMALASSAVAMMVSSCAYDPFAYNSYGSGTATYPVSYGSSDGYYDDYNGYDVAVPTAIGLTLVATSSQYWGYDPYRYAYYDYRQSCYYDPWLSCYYPRNYRPRPVYGVPHPYGWRPGHGVCPYPRNPRNRWVENRYDRLQNMKASHYAWAQKVRYNRQSWSANMRQYPKAWQHRLQPQNQRGQHARRPAGASNPMAGHRGNTNSGNRRQGAHGNSSVAPSRPGGTRPPANQNNGRKKFGGWFNTPVSAPAPGPRSAVNRSQGPSQSARQRSQAARQKIVAQQKVRQEALRQRIQTARQSPRQGLRATRPQIPSAARQHRSVRAPSRPQRPVAQPKIARPRTPAKPAGIRTASRSASRAAKKSAVIAAATPKTATAHRRKR